MGTQPVVVRSPVWAAGAVAFAAVGLATLSIAPKLWIGWILPRLQPHVTLWYVGTGGAILVGLGAWAWSAGAVNRAPAFAVLALRLIALPPSTPRCAEPPHPDR